MKYQKSLIICSQAIYQTKFWFKIALKLKKNFKSVIIICFDDESHRYLKKLKFKHHFVTPRYDLSKNQIQNILYKNKITNLKDIILHEKVYFGKRDNSKIVSKFCSYVYSIDKYLSKIDYKKYLVLQELGGFSSTLSVYYLTKKMGINNYFIEPSFYKGRFHIIKNTLKCNPIKNKNVNFREFSKTFNKLRSEKKILIPKKDKFHFQNPIFRILNLNNIYRFFNKLFKKYLFNYNFEFNEIFKYSFSYILNFINYIFLLPFYENRLNISNFLYYPLHVPNDFAITIRSPKYIDQIKLIKSIRKKINSNIQLFIKEHPARIGAINFLKIYKLLKYKNIKILNPNINTFDILDQSIGIITINSKTGFEALIKRKPLFVLGESYYKNLKFVNYIDNKSIDFKNKKIPKIKDINKFFFGLYENTFDGELYYCEKTNINLFIKSIKKINEY